MKKEMTCIVCPMGCQLQLDIDDATLKLSVSGNNCPRGIKYAHEELTNPKRTLTTTVLLERAELTRPAGSYRWPDSQRQTDGSDAGAEPSAGEGTGSCQRHSR